MKSSLTERLQRAATTSGADCFLAFILRGDLIEQILAMDECAETTDLIVACFEKDGCTESFRAMSALSRAAAEDHLCFELMEQASALLGRHSSFGVSLGAGEYQSLSGVFLMKEIEAAEPVWNRVSVIV